MIYRIQFQIFTYTIVYIELFHVVGIVLYILIPIFIWTWIYTIIKSVIWNCVCVHINKAFYCRKTNFHLKLKSLWVHKRKIQNFLKIWQNISAVWSNLCGSNKKKKRGKIYHLRKISILRYCDHLPYCITTLTLKS